MINLNNNNISKEKKTKWSLASFFILWTPLFILGKLTNQSLTFQLIVPLIFGILGILISSMSNNQNETTIKTN